MTFIMYTPKIRMITITCSNDILCLFILLERLTSANLYSGSLSLCTGNSLPYYITREARQQSNMKFPRSYMPGTYELVRKVKIPAQRVHRASSFVKRRTNLNLSVRIFSIDFFGLLLVLWMLLIPSKSFPQDTLSSAVDSTCIQTDLADVIRKARHKPPKVKAVNEGSLLLIPIIGSNPATGFVLGLGGQYAFKVPQSDRYSALVGSAQFTTKGQFLFLLKNNIFTKSNRIFFTGDWRFLVFSQSTYGLGTNAPAGGILDYQYNLGGIETSSDSLVQPMEFNFARLHQSMTFKISKGIYLGFGYNLDSYFKIKDEKLRLNPGDSLITSHYAYSEYYDFNPLKYTSSALNATFIVDTRDNMINPYKGYFALFSWRHDIFGIAKNANFYQLEWRSYHRLSKRNPRHLMAFWFMGNFTPPGEFPYLILPATAYDQRSRSARGYTQGRFRGNNLVYGEAEYRFPISSCGGIWGGVLFVNATSASAPGKSLALFESVKPGYGVGLRIMVDKNSRTNLAIDIGLGDKSGGFYLAASETF